MNVEKPACNIELRQFDEPYQLRKLVRDIIYCRVRPGRISRH